MVRKVPDIETIGYQISVSSDSFQDYEKLRKELSALSRQFFSKYGIKTKERKTEGLGGAGESLIELIKLLWVHKEFLLIPVQIITHFFFSIRNRLVRNYKYAPEKPAIHISLDVTVNSYSYGYPYVSDVMLSLLYYSLELEKHLKNYYSLFNFEKYIQFSVTETDYSIGFGIPSKKSNDFSIARLARQIKSLRLIDNRELSFIFKGPFLVRLEKPAGEGTSFFLSHLKQKTYYTVISTRVLHDYWTKSLAEKLAFSED